MHGKTCDKVLQTSSNEQKISSSFILGFELRILNNWNKPVRLELKATGSSV